MKETVYRNDWSHLAFAIGGLFVGSLLEKNSIDESKKSRAEKDNPEDVEEVCEEIALLLEEWEPDDSCETEGDYMQDLAEYLDEHTDWEVDVCPDTPEGVPDILIGDLLALELKLGLKKGERDRLVGQCAGYSRLWVTWAIIIDASDNKVGRLIDLLEDKGLEQIVVWKF